MVAECDQAILTRLGPQEAVLDGSPNKATKKEHLLYFPVPLTDLLEEDEVQ